MTSHPRIKRASLLLACALSPSASAAPITITETEFEARPQFQIVTPAATYFYDRAGGGFSRMIDRDGHDWIAFSKTPLSEFPASAAAGYRGIPNLVFGSRNPDAGAGHPGFDRCESAVINRQSIRSVTTSGRWAWRWVFTEGTARLIMEHTDREHAYWFLYEGPPGGRWSPPTHYWGTNEGGPRQDTPGLSDQVFGSWRWAYFGDRRSPRVLFLAQVGPDELSDTFWYLGNTRAGLNSPDGMVVFGFGRGPNATPLLRDPHEFLLGFIEQPVLNPAAHEQVSRRIEALLENRPEE